MTSLDGTSTAGEPSIRVGFVVHSMHVAGVETLVSETISELAHRIQPTVICLDSIGELGHKLRRSGVDVVCLDRRPGLDLRAPKRIAEIVREHGIRVLHAHQYTPFFYSALARLLPGGPFRIIFTEHGRHYPDTVSTKRRTLNRVLFSHLADEINACSRFSAHALAEVDGFKGRKIQLIPNGIRVRDYGPTGDRAGQRKRMGLDPDRIYVGCIARFHSVKDHTTLIDAFSRVADSRQDTELLLVGDGPLRSALESKVQHLQLTGKVRFMGVRSDVPELLRCLDVFALTSLSEAASLTVLEAMATAIPVVTTTVGGNPEMIQNGVDGLLVPRKDPSAAANAILHLLDHPEDAKSMGLTARKKVLQNYTMSTTIEAYHDLYRSLN